VPPRHHRTVDRVTAILELVAPVRQGLTLAALAERLNAPKSSVHELVNGLVATGYLIEHEHRYGLGPAPFILTLNGNRSAARGIDKDLLPRIHQAVGCSVLIGIQVGRSLVYVDQLGDEPALEFAARNHSRRSLYGTASGQAILAGLPVREMDELLHAATSAEQGEVRRFLAVLPEIRATGLAYNPGLTVPDVYSVATALRGPEGALVGAVCAIGPAGLRESLPDIGRQIQRLLRSGLLRDFDRGAVVHLDDGRGVRLHMPGHPPSGRVRVAGPDGGGDAPMRLHRGPADRVVDERLVLGRGEDGPRQAGHEPGQQLVVAGRGYGHVPVDVGLQEPVQRALGRDRRVGLRQAGQVGLGAVRGGEPGAHRLDALARLEQRRHANLPPADEQAHRVGHRVAVRPLNEGAARTAGLDPDQTLHLENAQRLAYRRAAQLRLRHHLALGRQRRSGGELPAQDALAQLGGEHVGSLRYLHRGQRWLRDRGLGGHRASASSS
jgi:DNA-binding IclR family transcriptional regulator